MEKILVQSVETYVLDINAPRGRRGMGHWAISSNLNCVLVGWRTSARPIQMGRLRQLSEPASLGEDALVLDD